MADQWADFPDATGGLPSGDWADFPDAPSSRPARSTRQKQAAHDGDTFRGSDGQNVRLYGADAFELGQAGLSRSGQRVDLGAQGQSALEKLIAAGVAVTPTGSASYGRPVVSAQAGGKDVARELIAAGNAVAAPSYLRADPPRLGDYMEAEWEARMNARGAFSTAFQMPDQYRRREPWAAPEASPDGKGIAVAFDEALPFQGLRPEIERDYVALFSDRSSTPADLVAFANRNGFHIDPDQAADAVEKRNAGAKITDQVIYEELPRPLTNPGDGGVGAFARGVGDPINMLDEMGAVVDTLGGTRGRINVWDSDARFGDIYQSNLDQNRSILEYDGAEHPWARFGGQVIGGLAAPGISVEGVGATAAREALEAGAGSFVAKKASEAAVRNRLAAAGAIEGGLAGAGGGEGGVGDRLPGALAGAGLGAAAGVAIGTIAPRAIDAVRSRFARRAEEPPVTFADPEAGARPPGADLSEGTPGSSRRMDEPATPADMAALARTVEPQDVRPRPANEIANLEEAERANPGTIREVATPDERDVLPRFTLPDGRARRQPLDLAGWLRTQGGVQDQAGELRALGIDNSPRRDLDFAKDEGFLGRLVNPDGMSLDEAADAAWRAGFLPDQMERPTIGAFLDALSDTHRGIRRSWRADDFETVNAFEATRAQRNRLEQAQAEGNPFVEEIGTPATLAGMDANAAPVTAYEDLPAIGARAGNIALDRLESPRDIRRALQSVEAKVGGFDAARRGAISHDETIALAQDMGMTAEDLLKRRQGQALNAEQALAARAILAKSGDELVRLAEKVGSGGDEAMAAFREGWLKHVAIQEQVTGATAEAGRALSQFRITAKASDARGRILKELVKEGGGQEEVAQAVLDLKDPAKVNRFLRQAAKVRGIDKLTELYMNSLLSGPQTHAVNILSNTLTSLAQLPEHAIAATIGQPRRLWSDDRVLGSELGARAVGLLHGVKEGLWQAARTMRTGEASDFMSKVEAQSQEAISGLKGKIIRTPTRALSAEDELFKAMARRMEIAGLAVREARGEGLKGAALKDRIAELTSNPTDAMIEKAFDYGRYVTFQRPLGPIGTGISRMTQAYPALKLIVPFVRTPTNILKFATERSPAAPILKEWRQDWLAGGARRDLAVSRMLVGTGVGALVTELAAKGLITGGGPADPEAERLMRADGWQPYSLKIGDRYVSYQRLDPFSTTLGVAADAVELQEHMTDAQRDKIATLMTASVMQNLSNKTWLSGLSDAISAMQDPSRFAEGWLARMAGSIVVPAAVAQVARTTDPILREARSPMDRIRSRIPGMSESLPSKRDVWGQPVRSEGALGPDLISPIWTSTARNSPAIKALLDAGAHVTAPSRKVGGIELNSDQYGRYQELAGSIEREELAALTRSPEWRTTGVDDQRDAVVDVTRAAKRQARDLLGFARSQPAASDDWAAFPDATPQASKR